MEISDNCIMHNQASMSQLILVAEDLSEKIKILGHRPSFRGVQRTTSTVLQNRRLLSKRIVPEVSKMPLLGLVEVPLL